MKTLLSSEPSLRERVLGVIRVLFLLCAGTSSPSTTPEARYLATARIGFAQSTASSSPVSSLTPGAGAYRSAHGRALTEAERSSIVRELHIAKRLLEVTRLQTSPEFRTYLETLEGSLPDTGADSAGSAGTRHELALDAETISRIGASLQAARERLEATASTFNDWCRVRDAVEPGGADSDVVPQRFVREETIAERAESPFPSLEDLEISDSVRAFMGEHADPSRAHS